MFSLILRFIGRNEKITVCDDGFIQKQLSVIRDYINKFPEEEQEMRAMEWIEKYAHRYRKKWEQEVLAKELSNQRCSDCPLSEKTDLSHCQIHERWLELLGQYASNKIDSKKYVEKALELLVQYKEDLRVKLSRLKKGN